MTHAEMRAALANAPRGAIIRSVLAAVLLHVGPNGEPCSASIKTIALEAGVDVRTAKKALRDLTPTWITRTDRTGYTTLFAPTPICPPSTDAPPQERTQDPTVPPEVKYGASNDAHRDDHLLTLDSGTQPSEGPARAPARARQAPPNADLFEALVLGAGWTLAGLTKSQRGMTARHAKELAAVDATPEQIAAFCEAWARRLGNRPAPPTVSKHWNPEESNVVHLSAVDRWKAHRAG